MTRTTEPTMISNSTSSNTTSFSIVFPTLCENFTDFIGHDVLAEQSTEYLLSENVTCLEHAPKLTRAVYLKVIVLAVMSFLSLICNLATIYSIIKNRRRQRNYSAMYTLILHLSVADTLVTIFCMVGEAIWSYNVAWLWGNAACKIFKFLQMFSLYLSTFVLVLIGVDRFIAIRYPIKGLNTSQNYTRVVLFIWALSFVLATPQAAVFHVAQGPFIEIFTQCVTHGTYTEAWQEQLYASFSLFFMFILPLAILIVTYVSTVITISQSKKKFKTKSGNDKTYVGNISEKNRRRLMNRAKARSLRISVVIVAAFLIWWTPYYTMMIIFLFLNPDEHLSEELQSGIFFFGMSNSLVNPLIYGAFHLWPQKQRQGSYQRSDGVRMHQQPIKKQREIQLPLLSHQNSGNKATIHSSIRSNDSLN
ncbi:gonadotropin-releasing hormone receptor [Pseudomyrmex gracilis]|uniref:gonadotropin-releasing hormone receptor n=1 Tax=Pseudomyrmex gracilis TaxID=219809 RepID=UPI000995C614|nr:gonadotropin-releasing hormone receptor [Pseudomyrmex gracilis]